MYLHRPTLLARKLYSKALWRVSTSEKKIFLTFDDGPIPEVTPWVLDTLKKYNVKAMFFCVGENIMRHPEIYQRILAEGHQTGNHTYNHRRGWRTTTEDYIDNVKKCEDLVQSNFFRPPYGEMKFSQISVLRSQFSIVMWDVLSGDFDRTLSKEKCLANSIRYTREGSVIVFHDSIRAEKNLRYVLPKYIEYFLEKGFVFGKLP